MRSRTMPSPLLLLSLFITAVVVPNEAKTTLNWPYYGCYEFDFSDTIFFGLPLGNTTALGCTNCKEQMVIAPNQTINELPHELWKGSIHDSSTTTPESCMSTCNGTGYGFAGVQDGSKCICANKHPHSKSSYENCNMACSGDENKTCGGDWKMNLYGAKDPFSPPIVPGTNGTNETSYPSYLGCYSNTLDRLLTGTYDNSETNSPITCVDSCIESGYAYAGLQYRTQCICANESPHGAKQNESSCDYACPGDASAKCGGHWLMNVYQIAPPVNCTWSAWNWGTCSKSCENGTQDGTRTISQAAEHGGNNCMGPTTATQSCNTEACPVDCEWSQWSEWATCSVTCGGGTDERNRTITVPAQNGGTECAGNDTETQECNTDECAIGYEILWSGRNCKWITTKEECETAARWLGFKYTTARETSGGNPKHPPGCWGGMKSNFHLYFNMKTESESAGECDFNVPNTPCVCRS